MKVVKEVTILVKLCKECGLEFEATNGMQKFCNRIHHRTCVICGKQFELTRYHLTAKDARITCSKKCTGELRKQTNIERYGGVAPACSLEIRQKMQETTFDRYGVKHAAQSAEVQGKMRRTNERRFGVPWYTQTTGWKEKSQKTSQLRYGTNWPTQSEKIKNKSIITSLDRYGTDYPMQSNEVKYRFIKSHMQDGSNLEKFIQYRENPVKFIEDLKLDHRPTIYELSRILGVNESTVGAYINMNDCKNIIEYKISVMEQEVADFIHFLDMDIRIEFNVHNIITPNELDIYLPEFKLAIECNPTATHNSTINVFDNGPSTIYPGYHLMKTKKCAEAGIFLFHIFGSEWRYNKPIIQSMIRNLLGKCTNKIYARDCNIKEINGDITRKFLNENHRQGSANSPIRLGLFHRDILVSVMTFGKMRSGIGKDNTDLSDCYELVRFCSKLDTSVIGGASKLFNYFVKNYGPHRIRSFSDRAHTKGNIYELLGFKQIRSSNPGYVWVDSKTDISYNRYNTQKHNLSKFLQDESIDMSLTEKQIMEDHGFLQVFDCGTILWEWISL